MLKHKVGRQLVRLFCKAGLIFSLLGSNIAFSTALNKEISGSAVLVLDASGSMWGQIDNKAKISIARDVITTTVSGWNPEVPLGLIAYGHNRKGDCKDIEVLIEPQPLNPNNFIKQANRLKPKGKTPISAAVLQAAELLKYEEEKATVILVSDGEETCELDPCALGESLENKGLDFTAHIISFDVPFEQTQGLRCLAQTTGGAYLEASNANELELAMQTLSAVVSETSQPDLSVATLKFNNPVVAGSEFEIHWTGPHNTYDYLIIRSSDRTKQFNSRYLNQLTLNEPTTLIAPEAPGEYEVFYEVNKKTPLGQTKLTVIAAHAGIEVPDSVKAGANIEVIWQGPANQYDKLQIVDHEGKNMPHRLYINQKSAPKLTLTTPEIAGTYAMQYQTRFGKVLAEKTFIVIAAQASVSASDSVIAGSTFLVKWTGPANQYDRLEILDLNGKSTKEKRFLRPNISSQQKLVAPEKAGEYEVHYLTRRGKSLAKKSFVVDAATASLRAPTAAQTNSQLEITWTGPANRYDRIQFFSLDGKPNRAKVLIGPKTKSPIKLKTPKEPGQYELRYYTHGGTTLAKQTMTIH